MRLYDNAKTSDVSRPLTPAQKLASMKVDEQEYAREMKRDKRASLTQSIMQKLDTHPVDIRTLAVVPGKLVWNMTWTKKWSGGRAHLSSDFQDVLYTPEMREARSKDFDYFPKGYTWPLPPKADEEGVIQRRVHVYLEYSDPFCLGRVLVRISDVLVNGFRHWGDKTIWDIVDACAAESPTLTLEGTRKFFYAVRNREQEIRIGTCSYRLPPPMSLARKSSIWKPFTPSLDGFKLVVYQMWKIDPGKNAPAGVRWDIPIAYRSVYFEEPLPYKVSYDTKGEIKEIEE